jgi:hypothetical protein
MTSTPRSREHTHILSTGLKHECPAHAMCYTYQILTAKPFFMAEKTVSVMELIAAGHAVALPQDAGVHSSIGDTTILFRETSKCEPHFTSVGQALCGMARVTGH